MKKLFFISILFWANFLFSQNTDWDTALSQIYTPTTGFSPEKVLLDKVPIFADLYNFNYPEFNTSNSQHFQQSLIEVNIASNNIFTNQTSFQNLVVVPNPVAVQEIPIGIISTVSAYLNYDEDDNNNGNLQLVNNVFVPINSSIPNFIEKDLLVISPLVVSASSATNSFKFKIDPDQLYQYMNNIRKLEADFGDGVWKILINNSAILSAVSANINTTFIQKQKITFRATFENNSQIITYAEILLSKNNLTVDPVIFNKTGTCGTSQLLEHRSTIADITGTKGKIEYKIWYGNENNTCSVKKPVIILDGFDPGDKRRIDLQDCINDKRCIDEYKEDVSVLTQERYSSLSKLMEYSEGSLIDKLNEKNFDVILVNLPYYNKTPNDLNSELICAGADDIIRNAYSIASFIQKLNSDLQTVGSTEKLVVVGPSMGGFPPQTYIFASANYISPSVNYILASEINIRASVNNILSTVT